MNDEPNEIQVGATNLVAILSKQLATGLSITVDIRAPDGQGLEADRFVMAVSAQTVRLAAEHIENGHREVGLGLLDSVATQLQVQSGAVTRIEERRRCPGCWRAEDRPT